MSNHAILLLAHGTPDTLSQMAEYLRLVTGGRPMSPEVIEELQHRYAEIGLKETELPEGPPLTRWTFRQSELLALALRKRVYVGMRNWNPMIAQTVSQMTRNGVTEATVLCLAPQNSRTSTGLYRKALDAALATVPNPFTYNFIAGWSAEPLLAQAFAEELWPTWAEACAQMGTRVPVLFTAHSVPCRTIRATTAEEAARGSAPTPGAPVPAEGIQNYGTASEGDPYPIECKQTAAAVAARLAPLGMSFDDWYFAFQSQGIAGAPWIGPTVEDTLKALADAGHKAVVIQPIGFLCDHVEILYDIDISFRDTAAELGMKVFRPQSLNDSPTLIKALVNVVTAANPGAPSSPRQ